MRSYVHALSTHRLIQSTGSIITLLLFTLLWSSSPPPVVRAAPPAPICTAPIQPVVLSNPTVITDCSNQTQLATALANGGHITFDCGLNPVTINITSPLVTSNTNDIVLDGQGLITLDGGNSTRILKKPASPNAHIDKVSGNDITIQNMRFINAKAPAATQNQDGNARGGAVWVTSPGTKLHIINSTFENNSTTSITDEDNQGGAVFAANIYETIIVGSVFDNNEAGNGGAFGAIASGLIVYNSRFTNNKASDATSGGIVRGHGGAIHLDGVTNSFNPNSNKIVDICGSTFEKPQPHFRRHRRRQLHLNRLWSRLHPQQSGSLERSRAAHHLYRQHHLASHGFQQSSDHDRTGYGPDQRR